MQQAHTWLPFVITFRSSFSVALMNTSPEEQVVDVPFRDVFRDLVHGSPSPRIYLILRLSVHSRMRNGEKPPTPFMTCGRRTRKGNGGRASERCREVYKGPLLQLIRRRSGSWSRLPNNYASVEDTPILVFCDLNTVYKTVHIEILTSSLHRCTHFTESLPLRLERERGVAHR